MGHSVDAIIFKCKSTTISLAYLRWVKVSDVLVSYGETAMFVSNYQIKQLREDLEIEPKGQCTHLFFT